MKVVMITGILGQDGSNLAEFLLKEEPDSIIYGIYKRGANPNTCNISDILGHERFHLIPGDITDQTSMDNLVLKYKPNYLVNFAANSFVGTSWGTPDQVFNVNTLGVLKCLEAIRKFAPECRFYSAGSSEEFGETVCVPQNEDHPLIPVSPYAVAKTAARHMVDVYRRSYGLFAIHGTLFNHEGPKRGTEFVTRKVTMNIAKILHELSEFGTTTHSFELGNIYAQKDWSDSRDMVRGIWMMLQQDKPIEFILASGKTRTIKEFVHIAFNCAGLLGKWIDNEDPINEYYQVAIPGSFKAVTINPQLYRPTEVGIQCGDYSRIREALGWEPNIPFNQMVAEMVENDERLIRKSQPK